MCMCIYIYRNMYGGSLTKWRYPKSSKVRSVQYWNLWFGWAPPSGKPLYDAWILVRYSSICFVISSSDTRRKCWEHYVGDTLDIPGFMELEEHILGYYLGIYYVSYLTNMVWWISWHKKRKARPPDIGGSSRGSQVKPGDRAKVSFFPRPFFNS